MTVRHFLMWYVGSLVFVATTGASGYRALEQLHGHSATVQEATAPAPTAEAKPLLAAAEPVAPPAAPVAPTTTPLPELPPLRQHVAALPAPKIAPPAAHPVHRAVASAPVTTAPTATHSPTHQVAVTQRSPYPAPQQEMAGYRPQAPAYAYYPYRSYYVYGSGYAYYGPYSRYPTYYVR